MFWKILWFFWDWKGSLTLAILAWSIPVLKGIWTAYQQTKQQQGSGGQITPLPDLFASPHHPPASSRCHMDNKNICCLMMIFWCLFTAIVIAGVCMSSYYHWHDTYNSHIKHLESKRVKSQITVTKYEQLQSDKDYQAIHDHPEIKQIMMRAKCDTELTDDDIKVQSDDHAWTHLRNDFKEWMTVIPGYEYFSDHSDVTAITLTNTFDVIRNSWIWTILSVTVMVLVITWCFGVVASTCQQAFTGMVTAVRSEQVYHNYPAFAGKNNNAFSYQTTNDLFSSQQQFSSL